MIQNKLFRDCLSTIPAEQKETLEELLYSLSLSYPNAEILGHRDLPGVRKACPSFDVSSWLAEINFRP